jgi:2-polyprenyl-3-methyl-5-hydroxy-6-metoxy-1,4-benzoquinol methylase
MRVNDLVRLDVKPRRIVDPFSYLERLASGKEVLNVGAAGGVKGYLPNNKSVWLHHRLGAVAASLMGVDIDKEGIDHAYKYGVEIVNANCEDMNLGKQFDLIVLSDVIEHMNAPVNAVENLMRHLAPQGTLCVTTPNAASLLAFGQILTGRSLNVYWDHVMAYCPEHIQAICDRCGFRLVDIMFFDHIDRRTKTHAIKSNLAATLSAICPRLASSFLAVIRHA